jgi:hypothetical protein
MPTMTPPRDGPQDDGQRIVCPAVPERGRGRAAERDEPLVQVVPGPGRLAQLDVRWPSSSGSPLASPPPGGTVAWPIIGNIDLDAFKVQEVGRVFVPLDEDPAANRPIALHAPGGTPFNLAAFGLFVNDDGSLVPADAAEVVDNVNFGIVTAVPEPSSLMLFGLGSLASVVVAARRWGRRPLW